MSYREIFRLLGRYCFFFVLLLLLPLGVALLYERYLEPEALPPVTATMAFLETMAIAAGAGLLCSWVGRGGARRSLHRKESILLVALIWAWTALLGALPFLLTHTLKSPIDAYFESTSGLTTTGVTILQQKAYEGEREVPLVLPHPQQPETRYTFYGTVAPLRDRSTGAVLAEGVDALGKPLLFWRSFLQWFGGIGIVILCVALLPALGMGGKFLYESEASGPTKEGMTPRIKETAQLLWKIYVGLTLAQILFLLLADRRMPLFDAVALTFATLSTGGFAVHSDGLARYTTAAGWVISLFMVLGAVNFSLYFYAIKRQFYRLRDPELYAYLAVVVAGGLLLTLFLMQAPLSLSWKEALYYGSFQAISAQTSTGFAIQNYDLWPLGAQILLIGLMYLGGMSGSTAGGIKMIRWVVMVRAVYYKLEAYFRPEVVRVLRIGSREMVDKTTLSVFALFALAIVLSGLGTYLLVLDGLDLLTAFGLIATAITNTGLTFGGIGSTDSVAFLSPFAKSIAVIWMLLGRLEFFALLVLLLPSFWRAR